MALQIQVKSKQKIPEIKDSNLGKVAVSPSKMWQPQTRASNRDLVDAADKCVLCSLI